MPNAKTVTTLFQTTPGRWGLRGDPYLWQEMQTHFEQTPLPATVDDLSRLVETAFAALTGYSIAANAPFFIERFSHGGMSSGQVSPEFWRETVVPLLRSRYVDIR